MKRKSLREWIRNNRKELDEYIRKAAPNIGSINDEERRVWVLNDESLYNWAYREGINV